jgi:hypothetical protein
LPEEAIKVTITDKANLISNGYFNVENVNLTYRYGSLTDASGNSYGGYTASEYNSGVDAKGTLNFASKNNTLFALTNANGSVNFDHSAQYTPGTLNYTVTSDLDSKVNLTINIAAASHKIVKYSQKPTVIFTATDPAVGTQFDDSDVENKVSNSISSDKFSATVYYKGVQVGRNCKITPSKLTASLSGLGNNFTTATCTFNKGTTSQDVVFTFKPDKLQDTQAVGDDPGDKKKCLGKDVTCTEMIVEYNGEKYTISLTNPIKITHEK